MNKISNEPYSITIFGRLISTLIIVTNMILKCLETFLKIGKTSAPHYQPQNCYCDI